MASKSIRYISIAALSVGKFTVWLNKSRVAIIVYRVRNTLAQFFKTLDKELYLKSIVMQSNHSIISRQEIACRALKLTAT